MLPLLYCSCIFESLCVPSQELKDPQCRDEMAAARGALKKNATMLYTASQAYLRHPDVAATRANRDYVFKQVQEAIGGISSAAQATSPTDEKHGHAGIGELAAALNEFDVSRRTCCSSSSVCCVHACVLDPTETKTPEGTAHLHKHGSSIAWCSGCVFMLSDICQS